MHQFHVRWPPKTHKTHKQANTRHPLDRGIAVWVIGACFSPVPEVLLPLNIHTLFAHTNTIERLCSYEFRFNFKLWRFDVLVRVWKSSFSCVFRLHQTACRSGWFQAQCGLVWSLSIIRCPSSLATNLNTTTERHGTQCPCSGMDSSSPLEYRGNRLRRKTIFCRSRPKIRILKWALI